MTIDDGSHVVCVRVGSKLIEKILLHISPDCLDRVIGMLVLGSFRDAGNPLLSVKPFSVRI